MTALAALAGVAAILYVPYFVPQGPVASDAYVFGYNNRAAVVLLAFFCVAGAIWKRGCNLRLMPAEEPARISTRVLWACLAIQFAICVSMIALVGRSGGFSEAHYEIDRVWLLAIGKVPYVGFEWPFGVSFLYGPVWIMRLVHCGAAPAYYAFWIAASLVGVALLYATINRLDFPTARKRTIFLLLFVTFLLAATGMGTHYTLLRFATPYYFMLLVYEMSMRIQWRTSGAAVCFAAILLLISPEMAIAFCFACCILLLPLPAMRRVSRAWLRLPAYCAMAVGFAMLFASAWKLHVLDTLRASGGGADSFPIPLSVPVLFFFSAVFFCSCVLVQRWRSQTPDDNGVCLILVAIPLLAAALGRCDPGHILCNGLGFLLAGLVYASALRRLWSICMSGFVIAMVVIPSLMMVVVSVPAIVKTARTGVVAPERIDFAKIYPGVDIPGNILEAPFGYQPNGWGSYLSSSVDYGYYEGLENANTPQAVSRKIAELAAHPERDVLVPRNAVAQCQVDGRLQRELISVLFVSPYVARVSHPVNVHRPLCDYIDSHYAVSVSALAGNFEYEVWRAK